jgi:ankyrin repeat protein
MAGEVIRILFESGMSALRWAAKCGHKEVVSYLLLQGFPFGLKSRLEIQKVKLGSDLLYCCSDPDTKNTFHLFSTEEDIPKGQFHVQGNQVSLRIKNLLNVGGILKSDILSGGATAQDLAVENGHESVERLLEIMGLSFRLRVGNTVAMSY